ncbi:MAG: hypothetical protein KGH99_04050, partial [Thaumarchaeota archaeon]|nr:hypothetical protein [Nitrososphaerota archaeon]
MNIRLDGLLLLLVILGSAIAVPAFALQANSQNVTNTTMARQGTPSHPPSYMLNTTSSAIGTPSSGAVAVTVTTDKSSYNDGDKVMVSGTT